MPKFSSRVAALGSLGGAKWDFYFRAKARKDAGALIIDLTIGEPEVRPPAELIAGVKDALDRGRVGYANGSGEMSLRAELARTYGRRTGRAIEPDQILCVPGTQNALYLALQTLVEPGDEVLVTNPLYATYEGLVAASGATPVFVPLRPENQFHIQPADIAAAITPRTRAILLNSPHNPTGAVLSAAEIAEIGALAKAYDFWIISDEVYEQLVFEGTEFASAFDQADLADRTVVVSSISKSHAAAGLRSGWTVSSAEFAKAALPITETQLFGNQPFIADATAEILAAGPSDVAKTMCQDYAARAGRVFAALDGQFGLKVMQPQAGMFVLIDARGRDQTGLELAGQLLDQADVAVMPGSSFGSALNGFVRVSMTVADADLDRALGQIRHVLSQ